MDRGRGEGVKLVFWHEPAPSSCRLVPLCDQKCSKLVLSHCWTWLCDLTRHQQKSEKGLNSHGLNFAAPTIAFNMVFFLKGCKEIPIFHHLRFIYAKLFYYYISVNSWEIRMTTFQWQITKEDEPFIVVVSLSSQYQPNKNSPWETMHYKTAT